MDAVKIGLSSTFIVLWILQVWQPSVDAAVRSSFARQGPVAMSPSTFDQLVAAVPTAVDQAMTLLEATMKAEADVTNVVVRDSPELASSPNRFRYVQQFLGSSPRAKLISYASFVQTKALGMLRTQFQLTDVDMRATMNMLPAMISQQQQQQQEEKSSAGPLVCPYRQTVACFASDVYRTFDGSCNNLLHPLWGAAHQPLTRFVPPRYADGIEAPRVSVTGRPLPSARLVSSTIHWDVDRPDPVRTLILMQMGQFIDHDMSRTAVSKMASPGSNGGSMTMKDIECGVDGCSTEGLENQECLPIEIPSNDTDFAGRKPCLMFVRSMEVPNEDCLPGPRQQLNQITAYLDASLIYGSSDAEARDLRDTDPTRGRLKVETHPAGSRFKPLLPSDPAISCRGDTNIFPCFKAGDNRVNEFNGITTQHLIWVREHNRIEAELKQLNPHWTGETLFQESRKIVTAVWQFVIYSEYLPLILGPTNMQKYQLSLVEDGYWNDYSDQVNAGIANSFATAAMRFGHTQLQGLVQLRDPQYSITQHIHLSTLLNHARLIYEEPSRGLDGLLLGLVGHSVQTRDPFITKQVTRHLFAADPIYSVGEDLMSLNIQRGRDHGLPGYNAYREWCGLTKAATFRDLAGQFPGDIVNRFERLYERVDDIDLWPAGISENSASGSLLGPTFTCILARQYANLKYGDRFWFENNVHNPSPLTPEQLRAIRRVKYAKMVCENSDTITHIQPNVFIHPLDDALQTLRESNRPADDLLESAHLYSSGDNKRVPCGEIPSLDLSSWQEQLQQTSSTAAAEAAGQAPLQYSAEYIPVDNPPSSMIDVLPPIPDEPLALADTSNSLENTIPAAVVPATEVLSDYVQAQPDSPADAAVLANVPPVSVAQKAPAVVYQQLAATSVNSELISASPVPTVDARPVPRVQAVPAQRTPLVVQGLEIVAVDVRPLTVQPATHQPLLTYRTLASRPRTVHNTDTRRLKTV